MATLSKTAFWHGGFEGRLRLSRKSLGSLVDIPSHWLPSSFQVVKACMFLQNHTHITNLQLTNWNPTLPSQTLHVTLRHSQSLACLFTHWCICHILYCTPYFRCLNFSRDVSKLFLSESSAYRCELSVILLALACCDCVVLAHMPFRNSVLSYRSLTVCLNELAL